MRLTIILSSIAIILAVISLSMKVACAADFNERYSIIGYTASWHEHSYSHTLKRNFNQDNRGIGLEYWSNDKEGIGAVIFTSSVYETTFYVARMRLIHPITDYLWLGYMYGVAKSEGYNSNRPVPFILPYFTIGYLTGVSINLFIKPKLIDDDMFVIAAQLKYSFYSD